MKKPRRKLSRVHPTEEDESVLVEIPEENEEELREEAKERLRDYSKLEFPNRTESDTTHGTLIVYKSTEEQDEAS